MSVNVSIIVCFRDAAWCIERCMAALVDQRVDGCDIEIIAVNNASRDDSAAIVSRFPRVRLLEHAPPGVYGARMVALAQARGRLLVFTDPDCVARPDWLAQLIRPFDAPDTKVVMGHTVFPGHSLILRTLQDYEMTRDSVIFGGRDTEYYYGRANNLAFRREVFDAFGPFEARVRGADSVLVRRCVDAFGPEAMVYRPQARVEHLEVDRPAAYYGKIATYARSTRGFSASVAVRTPSRGMRWRIYRRTCREHRYSVTRSALLSALLGLESLAWTLGWWTAGAPYRRDNG